MFASNTVTVLREEEAYSFLSLVSDCGGVLGLFIGFNFLMFWDFVVWALKKMRMKISERIERFKEYQGGTLEDVKSGAETIPIQDRIQYWPLVILIQYYTYTIPIHITNRYENTSIFRLSEYFNQRLIRASCFS